MLGAQLPVSLARLARAAKMGTAIRLTDHRAQTAAETRAPCWCETLPVAVSCAGAKNLPGKHNVSRVGTYMTGRRLSQRRTGRAGSGLTYLGPATHTSARVYAMR